MTGTPAAPAPTPAPAPEPGKWLALGVLAAWMATLGGLLWVQVRIPEPFLNDSVLHFGLIRALSGAAAKGQSILDPWVGSWGMGFPVFHYYQNLPHLAVLALWKLTFGALPLVQVFKLVEWIAVATLPLPTWIAARRLNFPPLAATAAAVLVLLTKTDYLHGLDLESYTNQGLGQFTQAAGGWLFPLALVETYRALRGQGGMAVACVLMTVTFLSHLALGYMAFVAAGLLAVLTPREIPRRILRLAVITAVTVAACAYAVVPILRDFDQYNLSDLVPTWKYASFGHEVILARLFRGELFDFERWPVVSLLVALGFGWAAVRTGLHLAGRVRQSESERFLLATFILFLLLYFGRPTWGGLLDYFPLGRGFHWSRAIYVVHVTGTLLAGRALVGCLKPLLRFGAAGAAAAFLIGAGILAVPAAERVAYLQRNASLTEEMKAGWDAEGAELTKALELAAEDRTGRVYAGQGAAGGGAWGGRFQVGWVPVYAWFPPREMEALGYLHHMWSLNSDFQSAFDERNPVHYRVFNVSRIIAPPEIRFGGFARPLQQFGRFRVLSVDGPGFVELVDVPYEVEIPKSNVARAHRAWLHRLAPLRVHPRWRVVEEDDPPTELTRLDKYDISFPAASPPGGRRGEVLSVSREGDDFVAEVRTDRTCHVLLKMTYHPGWKATVDGHPVEPVQLLPAYVGVPVEAGNHRVEFRWAPGSLKTWLAGAGVVVLAVFGLVSRRLRI